MTRQFSLLTDRESVVQGYSWLQFAITSIRQGSLPIWDPYTLSGHSFTGEMQTGAFYPFHLLLALVPFNRDSVLPPTAYHVWFAFTHVLAACFMFALVREFGLSRFSAFIAGICFSLGGLVARVGWPDFLESSIWLPLVFLFFLRALRASTLRRAIVNACIGGVMFGMSVLAGRLHVVLMEALVIASAGIVYACSSGPADGSEPATRRSILFRAAMVVAVLGGMGFAAGAVQLFPSLEYSSRAYRYIGDAGALPANEKIPYAYLSDQFLPHGIAQLVAPYAFNGKAAEGEASNPYIGAFPLLAAVIGIRRYWRNLLGALPGGTGRGRVPVFVRLLFVASWSAVRHCSRVVEPAGSKPHGVPCGFCAGHSGGAWRGSSCRQVQPGRRRTRWLDRAEPHPSRNRHRVRRRVVCPGHVR